MERVSTREPHPWVAEGWAKLRFGVCVTTRAPAAAWPVRRDLARAAEELGADSFWVPDHPAFAPDCWSQLATLAISTDRLRLGPLVGCVYYRGPAVLGRLAADVDRLSGGRLVLGLGTGWFEPEFRALDIPFPPPRERHAALRHSLQVVHALWGDEPFRVDPATFEVVGSALAEGPVQQPYVPVLIGGQGERVTLRLVAAQADMCNIDLSLLPGQGQQGGDIRPKFDALRRHCEELGRPYEAIIRSHLLNPVVLAPTKVRLHEKLQTFPPLLQSANPTGFGTPSDLISFYRPIVAAGAQYLIINLATHDDLETLELFARHVMPELQALASTS